MIRTGGVMQRARLVAPHLIVRPVVSLVVVLALTSTAIAMTPRDRTFAELLSEADQIVVATVTSTTASQLPQGPIVTDVRIAVLRNLKGPANPGSTIEIRMLGGKVGAAEMRIADAPMFVLGQKVVLFIRGNGVEMFPFVGVQQGVFYVQTDAGGQDRVLDAAGHPVTAIDDSVQGDPSGAATPIALEEFLLAIQSRMRP
jgi:hypothetical protein